MTNNKYTNKQMHKHSRVFVAGGTGLVGSAIIKKLLEKGYTNIVANYHSRPPVTNNQYSNIPISWQKLDLTDQQATEEFFKQYKPEFVFLAAAKVGGIHANKTYPAEFIYKNTMIASNIIQSSYKTGVKKLLNLGSSCIYPKYAPQPLKEKYLLEGPLEPTNEAYAIAKISAIKMCKFYNEQYLTNFVSLMPTNLYGPGDNYNLENSHVLPALIRKMHLCKLLENEDFFSVKKDLSGLKVNYKGEHIEINKEISKEELLKALTHYGIYFKKQKEKLSKSSVTLKLWGDGSPYREFLYSEDLADAAIFFMKNINADDIKHLYNSAEGSQECDYFVNVGTGKDLTIKELADYVARIVGFEGKIEWDTSKPKGTPRKLLDISMINKLGWNYATELGNGIKMSYRDYLNSFGWTI